MLAAAMDGAMTFHTALRKRLDIIKPSRSLLTRTLTLRPPSQHLSPNVSQLVALLHSRQVAVYLVKSPCTWSAAASRFHALMPPPPFLLHTTCWQAGVLLVKAWRMA